MIKRGEITDELLRFALNYFGKPNPKAITFLVDHAVMNKSTNDLKVWLVENLEIADGSSALVKPALLAICGMRDFEKWKEIMDYIEVKAPKEFKKMATLTLQNYNWVDAWLSAKCGGDMTKWKDKDADLEARDLMDLLNFAKIMKRFKCKPNDTSALFGQTTFLVKNLLELGHKEAFVSWCQEWLTPAMESSVNEMYFAANTAQSSILRKKSFHWSKFFKDMFVEDMSEESVQCVIYDVILKSPHYEYIWSKDLLTTSINDAERANDVINHPWFDVLKQIVKSGVSPQPWIDVLKDTAATNEGVNAYAQDLAKLLSGQIKSQLGDEQANYVIAWWQRKELIEKNSSSGNKSIAIKAL